MNTLLNKINVLIDKYDITNENNILLCYNHILDIIKNDKIEINEINNLIKKIIKNTNKNCKKCDNDKCKECIQIKNNNKFINFIEIKNKYIIKLTTKLNSYNKLIEKIKLNIENKFNKKINTNIIKDSFNTFLSDKIHEINGNWNIIKCNLKGYPIKIEILNHLDYLKINDYILKN